MEAAARNTASLLLTTRLPLALNSDMILTGGSLLCGTSQAMWETDEGTLAQRLHQVLD